MSELDSSMCLRPILRNLEAIQVELGKAQLALLDLLADSEGADCEDARRTALIRLESIQRGVGEVQIMLFREVGAGDPALAELDAPSEIAAHPTFLPVVPKDPAKPAEPPVVSGKTAAIPVLSEASEAPPSTVSLTGQFTAGQAQAAPPSQPSAPKVSPIAPQGQKPGSLPSASDSALRSAATNRGTAPAASFSVHSAPPRTTPPSEQSAEKSVDAAFSSTPASGASMESEGDPSTGGRTFLEAWLDARGCRIKELRKPTGMDAAADDIALFLGQHYAELELPYSELRARLNPRRTDKWLQTKDWPPPVMSMAAQFGRKLLDNGFLAQFVNVSKNRTMLCEPVSDSRVLNFLDGGWLERWAAHVMKTAIIQKMGTWQDGRLLQGVQIELPNRTEAELDILANPYGELVIWLECKAGNWQSDLRHYYDLNQQHFHLPDTQAALVLVDRVKEAGRASAGELSSMTILHLTELAEWLGRVITATAG